MKDNLKRLVVYLDEADYTKLRMLLFAEGKTASAWAREIILKYLNSRKK